MFYLFYQSRPCLTIALSLIVKLKSLVKGIIKGCRISNCSLVGGETAEMPLVYNNNSTDLVGCIIGEKNNLRTIIQRHNASSNTSSCLSQNSNNGRNVRYSLKNEQPHV